MKIKFAGVLIGFSLLTIPAFGQGIASLDFESVGGYSTSVLEFSDGFTDYFTRTDGTNISSPGYVNSGSWFAAQDIDGEGAVPPLSFTWTVNITGYTDLGFNFDVAEDDDGTNQDWDDLDYVHVLYSIDGGAEQNLIWFENDGSQFNSAPLQDTDFDGVGDGSEITETFANYAAPIIGVGSSLDIRIEFALDSGDEDFAMDNLQVTGVPEPSTIAAIFGLIGLGFVLMRRRH